MQPSKLACDALLTARDALFTARKALPLTIVAAAIACAPASTGQAPTNTSEITLASCTTSIASDAPAFYRNYFKCVTVTQSGTTTQITSNGLPPHKSYYYGSGNPNYADFDTSRGSQYKGNPNKIAMQTLKFSIPVSPTSRGLTITSNMVDKTANTNSNEYSLGAAGIAADGVAIFNDQAGPGDSIENEKYTFDSYNGHPEQRGAYHYHTDTPGPLEALKALGLVTKTTPGEAEIEFYGIMCDGTAVLGCTELDGTTPDGSGFDAQNGHTHDLKDKSGTVLVSGRYHTHVCTSKFTGHKFTPEIQFYSTCTK